ncbi:MAG: repeat-containing protein, partial [Myxococcales bacterium]|nr:repeat-containing protein [Myxococcales bacterium]
MADLSSLLAVIEHDPEDAQALEALAAAARASAPDVRTTRFAAARKVLSGRNRPDGVVHLIDVELDATTDLDRKIDLLLEKGMALDGELLDVKAAREVFAQVLKLRPQDEMATDALEELDVAEKNW